jgi:hypothetical protein
VDAALLVFTGHLTAAALAVGGFYLTRTLQRSIPGS